jgi:putative hemolysin
MIARALALTSNSRAERQPAWTSWLLRFTVWRTLYEQVQAGTGPFASRVLRALDVQVDVGPDDLLRIPASGPLLVAANHPHGALDGLALASIVGAVRSDVRVVANHLLAGIPELRDLCFFVDPFDRGGSASRSRAGLRSAHLWLRRGGALVIFPAGEVAHGIRAGRRYRDSEWRHTAGRLALATGAQVLPAFVEGANSRLFYLAGRLHAALRTALLAHELINKRGATIAVRVGEPMRAVQLGSVHEPDRTTRLIRVEVDALASANGSKQSSVKRSRAAAVRRRPSLIPPGFPPSAGGHVPSSPVQ